MRGVIVHRLLQSLDFVSATLPGAEQVADLARELGVTVSAAEREELAALVLTASTSELGQRLAGAPRIRRELPFAFSLNANEPLVTGVLDAAAHDLGGDLLIVDYKTDRVAAGEDLEAVVERAYGIQRLLYALAGLRDGAHEVEVVHWFLERPSEWVAARFGAGEQGALEGQLVGRIEAVRTRGFSVSAAPHRALCLTCPGRARLCSWGDAQALREPPEGEGVGVHVQADDTLGP
jgi:ATP-dependent helicase/nuclease subunit A